MGHAWLTCKHGQGVLCSLFFFSLESVYISLFGKIYGFTQSKMKKGPIIKESSFQHTLKSAICGTAAAAALQDSYHHHQRTSNMKQIETN